MAICAMMVICAMCKSQWQERLGSEWVAILYAGKPSPIRWYLSRDLKEVDHRKDKSKVTVKMNEDQVSLFFLWCYSVLSKFHPHAMLITLLLS